MPSGRGVAVLFAGLAMWLAARIIGSPGLEVIALGLAALPAIAAHLRPLGTPADRRPPPPLRHPRVARHPGDGPDRRREPVGRRHVVPAARGPAPLRPGPPGQARRLGDPGARHPGGHLHGPAADPRPISARAAHGRHVGPVRPGPSATRVRRTRGPDRDTGDRGPDRHAGRGVRGERRRLAHEEPLPHRRGVPHDAPVPRGRRPPSDPLAERRPHRRADRSARTSRPSGPTDSSSSTPATARSDRPTARRSSVRSRSRRPWVCCFPAAASPCGSRPPTRPPPRCRRSGSSRRSPASVIPRRDRSVPRSRTSAPPHRATRRLVVVAAPPQPVELTSLIRSGGAFGPKLAVLVYPRRPRHPAARATGPAGGTGHAGPARPDPRRMGLHHPAPVHALEGQMARPQGTSPRAQRLIALFAVCAIAIATAFAFGRVFEGHGSTWRLMGVALASALVASALERRNLLLATLVSAAALAVVVGLLVFPGTTWHGLPTLDTLRHALDASASGRRAGPPPGRALAAAEAPHVRLDPCDVGGDLLLPCARLPGRQPDPRAPAAHRHARVRRHRARGVHQAGLRRRVPGGGARDRLRRRAPPGAGMGTGVDRSRVRARACPRRPAGVPGGSRSPRWAPR